MELIDLQLNRTWQYAAYFALSLVTLVFTLILLPTSVAYFGRFLGEMNVIFVIVATSIVGAAALWVLDTTHTFVILKGKTTLRGIVL